MDLKKNELSKARVLPRLNQVLTRLKRLKRRYYPEQTDRNKYRSLGIKQSKQTEIWVLPRPNTPKHGFCPDQTNRNTGINQTKQAEIWVLTRPKYNLKPDRTDQTTGRTEIWTLTRFNRPK